jgi:hypothetical protein
MNQNKLSIYNRIRGLSHWLDDQGKQVAMICREKTNLMAYVLTLKCKRSLALVHILFVILSLTKYSCIREEFPLRSISS